MAGLQETNNQEKQTQRLLDAEVADKLRLWAARYHNADFIAADPVQFPHRFTEQKDIEISGLLTAIMSFGNRKQIVKKANELHDIMGSSPYEYVMSKRWENDFEANRKQSFYRMLMYSDFNHYFSLLYDCYSKHDTLEHCLQQLDGASAINALCRFMGVSNTGVQKKLNMFLRWMVRQNSDVDFGLWKSYSQDSLIIPLDVHVCRQAFELGLIDKETFSLSNAKRITAALATVFPGDPCLGDFALFGYGVEND